MSAKYGVIFLTLTMTALFAAWAIDHRLVQAVAVYAAFAFALVSTAYAMVGPRLLLKHPSGRRRLDAWLLYWPYFFSNGLSMGLFRLTERNPPFVQIVPNLFLGRLLTAREARRVGTPKWCAVLDLTAEFPEAAPLRSVSAYRSLPVLDAMAPTLVELSAAVVWLAERVAEGPVYIHCALGHGRSATVVVAYLLANGGVTTVEEGLALVRSRRAGVALNARQIAVLRRYAQSLAGEGASEPDITSTGQPRS